MYLCRENKGTDELRTTQLIYMFSLHMQIPGFLMIWLISYERPMRKIESSAISDQLRHKQARAATDLRVRVLKYCI